MVLHPINFVHTIHLRAPFKTNHCFDFILNFDFNNDFEFLNLVNY